MGGTTITFAAHDVALQVRRPRRSSSDGGSSMAEIIKKGTTLTPDIRHKTEDILQKATDSLLNVRWGQGIIVKCIPL